MSTTSRIISIAIGLALLATACSPAASEEVATTAAPTTTTPPPQPTTAPPTTATTTTTPIATVLVVGDIPFGLAEASREFLSVVQDPRNDTQDSIQPSSPTMRISVAS